MKRLIVRAVDVSGDVVFEEIAYGNDEARQMAESIKRKHPEWRVRYQHEMPAGFPFFGQLRWTHLVVQNADVFNTTIG